MNIGFIIIIFCHNLPIFKCKWRYDISITIIINLFLLLCSQASFRRTSYKHLFSIIISNTYSKCFTIPHSIYSQSIISLSLPSYSSLSSTSCACEIRDTHPTYLSQSILQSILIFYKRSVQL